MALKIIGGLIFKQNLGLSQIRHQNELKNATLIQRRYSNHLITKRNRDQLLDNPILLVVATSYHRHRQHAMNQLRFELRKDHIFAALDFRNSYWLPVS